MSASFDENVRFEPNLPGQVACLVKIICSEHRLTKIVPVPCNCFSPMQGLKDVA